MGLTEDIALAQLFQQEDPIDAAVKRLMDERLQPTVNPTGIPEQVAMKEFLPFASTIADSLTPKPLSASQAFLDSLQRGYDQRDPFAHIAPLVGMALEAGIPPESGVPLLKQLGPLTHDMLIYSKNLPRELAELAGTYVGPKSKVWSTTEQVGPLAGTKVVDEAGNPLKVFHGTNDVFNQYEVGIGNRKDPGWLGEGIYHTTDPKTASDMTLLKAGNAPNVRSEYVDIKNPLVIPYTTGSKWSQVREALGMKPSGDITQSTARDVTDKAKSLGYDGIIYDYSPMGWNHKEIVSFEPSQIHNALGGPPETYPQGAFSNLYDSAKVGPVLEISDAGAKLRQLAKGVDNPLLGELYDHPELYQHYPELADMRVIFSGTGDSKGAIKMTASGKPYMELNQGYLEPLMSGSEDMKEVVIHEIQHAIQEREGWARGGHPTTFLKSIQEARDEIENQIGALNKKMKESVGKPEYVGYMKDRAKLVRKLSEAQMLDPIDMKEQAYKQYRRLFGEYMARDAAARARLDLMDRLKTMPFSSEAEMTPDRMIYRYK